MEPASSYTARRAHARRLGGGRRRSAVGVGGGGGGGGGFGFGGGGGGKGGGCGGKGGGKGDGGGKGKGKGAQDRLIGMKVRVTKGAWKGYIGLVKAATGDMVRIEPTRALSKRKAHVVVEILQKEDKSEPPKPFPSY